MIKKIISVDKFGIFNDFKWGEAVEPFNRYNLIYGWNYSGKTTLSKIFQCFEHKKKCDDYIECSFKLTDSENAQFSEANLDCSKSIRVFNSEYVKHNLKWFGVEEKAEPIFILGEENIELQKQLDEKRKQEEASSKLVEDLGRKKISLEKKRDDILSKKASEIKNTLNIVEFDRPKFMLVVPKAKGNDNIILGETDFQNAVDKFRNKPMSIANNIKEPKMIDVSELQNIRHILEKEITATVIDKLKKDPELNEWTRKGLHLHSTETVCKFCDGQLPNDLLSNLRKHFSDEYDTYVKRIKQALDGVIRSKEEVNLSYKLLPDKSIFYPEFGENFDSLKEQLKIEIIQQINSLIDRHNGITSDFERKKVETKDMLLLHYAGEFVRDEKFFELVGEIENSLKEMHYEERNRKAIHDEYVVIEKQISGVALGATYLNNIIKSFLFKSSFEVSVTDDGKYSLMRKGKVAKNLSEGKKTAISFAYFAAKILDRDTKLDNTIVFIDDPISSFDNNHIFKLATYIEKNFEGCKQLFVSTHNIKFFNLIKDWMDRKNKEDKNKKLANYYLIERIYSDEKEKTSLIELPETLKRFKSEYQYLYSIIHEFNKLPSPDYNKLFLLPNITRRFLESFVNFKISSKDTSFKNNYFRVFGDNSDTLLVYTFINKLSHTTSFEEVVQHVDYSECVQVIKKVMEQMAQKDKEHYDSLVASVS
jgi:wobble nucleotide-excising tRNase